ncbi:hypothetical protein Tcan_07893 [Toxocara canis]|uniref:Uncharacterized protein n=2 Tax=Toxocara canis TaxID=6265 RepID=A0A0B2VT73_TOXCA|nr:hypothetical protein Tcan_07893 [Toxocara canis]VDM25175.1 unnamed protein product [Toxocara canis]
MPPVGDFNSRQNRSEPPCSSMLSSTEILEISKSSPGIAHTRRSLDHKAESDNTSTLDEGNVPEGQPQPYEKQSTASDNTLDMPVRKGTAEISLSLKPSSSINSRLRVRSRRKPLTRETFASYRRVSDATLVPRDELLQFDHPETMINIVDSIFTSSLDTDDQIKILQSVSVSNKRGAEFGMGRCGAESNIAMTPFIGRREMIERISKRNVSRGIPKRHLEMSTANQDSEDGASNRPSDVSSWRYLDPKTLAMKGEATELGTAPPNVNHTNTAITNNFLVNCKQYNAYFEV